MFYKGFITGTVAVLPFASTPAPLLRFLVILSSAGQNSRLKSILFPI